MGKRYTDELDKEIRLKDSIKNAKLKKHYLKMLASRNEPDLRKKHMVICPSPDDKRSLWASLLGEDMAIQFINQAHQDIRNNNLGTIENLEN